MPSHIIFSTKDLGVAAMKNKLKVYRAMHTLTQEQLADTIGVSRQTVNAIESDKYLPSLGLAFKITNLFKVKVEDIFIHEGEENDNEN